MEDKDAREYGEEILRLVDEFKQKVVAGTSDADRFMTISDIERLWTELRGNTSLLYSDMLSELLSGVDESSLIRKKKRSTAKKG